MLCMCVFFNRESSIHLYFSTAKLFHSSCTIEEPSAGVISVYSPSQQLLKENYLKSPAMNDCYNHFFSSSLLGILHKGNGENQFLTQQPAVITSIMGNGRRRSISCPSCNGLAEGNKLLAPVALAVGIDGSLFVGDFNYIRRIFPSRNVTSILELR